jgi:hypothetical protein
LIIYPKLRDQCNRILKYQLILPNQLFINHSSSFITTSLHYFRVIGVPTAYTVLHNCFPRSSPQFETMQQVCTVKNYDLNINYAIEKGSWSSKYLWISMLFLNIIIRWWHSYISWICWRVRTWVEWIFHILTQWKLNVNVEKTKIMIFQRVLWWRNVFIPIHGTMENVKEFKYQGISLSRSGSFCSAKEHLCDQTQKAM